MSNTERIAPTILVNGETITPPNWMWVMTYAMSGCEWAIIEADKPEFKAQIRAHMASQQQASVEAQITHLEQRLAELKAQLPFVKSADISRSQVGLANPNTCKHPPNAWTEESRANNWRSHCRLCGLRASGSGQ